jgi:hypothetical protein
MFFCKEPLPPICSCPENMETDLSPARKSGNQSVPVRKYGNQSHYGKNSRREGVHDAIGYGNRIIF